jgi:pentatricopeptide repeat domain-containing protein 1
MALSLLGQMRERGVTPNEFSFSAAITACGKGGQWEQALSLLKEMRVCSRRL